MKNKKNWTIILLFVFVAFAIFVAVSSNNAPQKTKVEKLGDKNLPANTAAEYDFYYLVTKRTYDPKTKATTAFDYAIKGADISGSSTLLQKFTVSDLQNAPQVYLAPKANAVLLEGPRGVTLLYLQTGARTIIDQEKGSVLLPVRYGEEGEKQECESTVVGTAITSDASRIVVETEYDATLGAGFPCQNGDETVKIFKERDGSYEEVLAYSPEGKRNYYEPWRSGRIALASRKLLGRGECRRGDVCLPYLKMFDLKTGEWSADDIFNEGTGLVRPTGMLISKAGAPVSAVKVLRSKRFEGCNPYVVPYTLPGERLEFYNAETGQIFHVSAGSESGFEPLVFSQDGKYVLLRRYRIDPNNPEPTGMELRSRCLLDSGFAVLDVENQRIISKAVDRFLINDTDGSEFFPYVLREGLYETLYIGKQEVESARNGHINFLGYGEKGGEGGI